jgi:hypothetical protein
MANPLRGQEVPTGYPNRLMARRPSLGDIWEEFRVVAEEVRDLDAMVLVFMRLEGRGKGSGVPVTA